MGDYLSARLYFRESAVSPWSQPSVGDPEQLKAKVRGLVLTLGQPTSHSLTESGDADVTRLKWDTGAELRLVLDKSNNYELIHCPSCSRQMFPPPYAGTLVECSHGWQPEWAYSPNENIWRCNHVYRELP